MRYLIFLVSVSFANSGSADADNICLHVDENFQPAKQAEISRLKKLDSLDAKFNLASCYMMSERFDDAITIYRELEKAHGESIELNKAIGVALYQKGEYESALNKLIASIHPDFRDPETILYIGLAFEKTGDLEHGIEALKMGIDALEVGPSAFKRNSYSPLSEDLHFHLGQMYLRKGDASAAAGVLSSGIKLYPGSRKLFDTLMEIYKKNEAVAPALELKKYCSDIAIHSSRYCRD
jgi:tetratricopeptide (TPR) repeat protein